MKDLFNIFILTVWLFFSCTASLNAQSESLSDNYFNLADSLIQEEKYSEAAEMYGYCLEVERSLQVPDLERISECQTNQGVCYFYLREYDKAIVSFEASLRVQDELGNRENIADCFSNIGLVYKKRGYYNKALDYYRQALEIDKELGNEESIAISLNNIGVVYDLWGRYGKAIEYYQKSLRIKEKQNNKDGMAVTLNNIGLVYNTWEKFELALGYFEEALAIDRELDDQWDIANRLNNIGLAHFNMQEYDTALYYYKEALTINIRLGQKDMVAFQYNNMGMVYYDRKDYDQAIFYLEQSVRIYEELQLKANISKVYSNIAEVHFVRENYDLALAYQQKSLQIAKEIGLRNQIKEGYKMISGVYLALGDHTTALRYYQQFTALKDSLFSEEMHAQIANFEVMYETERKDKEIRLLRQNELIKDLKIRKDQIMRNSLIGGLTLLFLLILLIWISLWQKTRAHRIIAVEKAKSDKLLLNILPDKVANDLKEKGHTIPEKFDEVTVFFSDIVGFTEIAAKLEPQDLIRELNEIFTEFDNINERNHCERIKTIGDGYLAVCGLPEANTMHTKNIINSALEIIRYIEQRNRTSEIQLPVRIGVHTGKVVAGVVGVKKYIYDVFGDTINTAARMESCSETMKINVSEATYLLVKDQFTFVERGGIETKGKGKMKMYFVDSL